MHLEYSVFSIDHSHNYVSDCYQYWIILSGQCHVFIDIQDIRLKSHDLLELPDQKPIYIQIDQPVNIGCIRLSDFLTTNRQIKYLPCQETELILKVFYLRLICQALNIPITIPL